MDKKLVDKIYDLGSSLRGLESLSRALVVSFEQDYNFKTFDEENLARIILMLLENLNKDFNDIDKMLVSSSSIIRHSGL